MKNFLNTLISRAVFVLFVTATWIGLWGDVSFANIAGGALLSGAILIFGLGGPQGNGIQVRPLLRLVWLVAVDLVTSSVSVGYEVIRPSDQTDESIIAVDLPAGSRRHLLLLTILITVTPGTAVVDVDTNRGTLYLHLLHHDKADATRRHVTELADLSCRGLPHLNRASTNQPTTGAPS